MTHRGPAGEKRMLVYLKRKQKGKHSQSTTARHSAILMEPKALAMTRSCEWFKALKKPYQLYASCMCALIQDVGMEAVHSKLPSMLTLPRHHLCLFMLRPCLQIAWLAMAACKPSCQEGTPLLHLALKCYQNSVKGRLSMAFMVADDEG